MADGREVLAALDGGVSRRRVGAWRLLDVFHLHFFVMDPQVRGPEVLLAALPFANAVGGPFPTEQNQEADVSTVFEGFSSLFFFFSVNSSQKRERGNKSAPRRNPVKARRWQPGPAAFPLLPWSLAAFRRRGAASPGPGGLPGSASRQRPRGGLQREVTVG